MAEVTGQITAPARGEDTKSCSSGRQLLCPSAQRRCDLSRPPPRAAQAWRRHCHHSSATPPERFSPGSLQAARAIAAEKMKNWGKKQNIVNTLTGPSVPIKNRRAITASEHLNYTPASLTEPHETEPSRLGATSPAGRHGVAALQRPPAALRFARPAIGRRPETG